MEADPSDPQVWWRLLVEAVAGLQRNDKTHATTYLQFVEQHRGRAVAVKAKANLIILRDAESWAGCFKWINNGYKPVKEKPNDWRTSRPRPSGRKR